MLSPGPNPDMPGYTQAKTPDLENPKIGGIPVYILGLKLTAAQFSR